MKNEPVRSSSRVTKVTKADIVERFGGFMQGVCHPNGTLADLKDAGFHWVRRDVPFPYGQNMHATKEFRAWRDFAVSLAEHGIRSVGISPYPSAFIARGYDVTAPAGLAAVEDICARMASDLGDAVLCWQATNEMFVPAFRAPLTSEQAVDFTVASIRGLRRGNPRAIVGQNNHNAKDWALYNRQIEEKCGGCDYAGVDMYAGTWAPGGPADYLPALERVAEESGLPVILMEFGFASAGGMTADITAEAETFLRAHGFADGKDAADRVDDYITRVLDVCSPDMAARARTCAPADKVAYLYQSIPHVLRKWPAVGPIEHTEAGQAAFYAALLPSLITSPCVAGAMLYCMKDSAACFTCGSTDCPCETAWGLLRADGSRKPAFDAVAKVFRQTPPLSDAAKLRRYVTGEDKAL